MLPSTTNETCNVPVLALRGIVAFPSSPIKLELRYPHDLNAILLASDKQYDNKVFLATLYDPEKIPPYQDIDFNPFGCLAVIEEIAHRQGGMVVTLQVTDRAAFYSLSEDGDFASVCPIETLNDDPTLKETEEYKRMISLMGEMLKLIPGNQNEMRKTLLQSETPGSFADSIALTLLMSTEHKMSVLEEFDALDRLKAVNNAMEEEIPLLKEDLRIHRKVRDALDENQREYYLKEQLKVLKEELGMDEEDDEELTEYRNKILSAHFPSEIEEKLIKELNKLAKSPFSSAEAAVQRNYLDTVLEIPFNNSDIEKPDVKRASEILEKDHYGLQKVKDRILEFVAARQLNPELKNRTLCLVGPPGVGKTSIATSLATALNRKYVRISLGGVRDEADIRGHRKTYVASMPGRIITALIQAKSNNPLILLDEIDKMASDGRGDPASAMLEVLDAEQNKTFRDHFVELPFDLSNCIFIATANSLDGVAPALIDRMEIIQLSSYTAEEKKEIAKKHLIPKERKKHGLTAKQLKFSDAAIDMIVSSYTHEAGVRNLERSIAAVCRKATRNIVENGISYQTITVRNLVDYLGHEKTVSEKVYDENLQGVVNGLAWTEAGGELLRVEAISMPGQGKTECTGNIGKVMSESTHIALSCLRSNADTLGVSEESFKNKDVHIHFPEGATPKDGPSAGCAIYTALVSEFTGRPVKNDIAMTGEITLHGRVLPIGGLREKTMAAYKAGVHTVILPEGNRKDLPDIDKEVIEHIEFKYCKTVNEVIANALV